MSPHRRAERLAITRVGRGMDGRYRSFPWGPMLVQTPVEAEAQRLGGQQEGTRGPAVCKLCRAGQMPRIQVRAVQLRKIRG